MTTTQKLVDKLIKLEKRVQTGIEARSLGQDYIAPLFRSLLVKLDELEQNVATNAANIETLAQAVESDPDVELLQDCRDVIIKLSALLDETMVAAGFFAATPQGLQSTGKAPGDLGTRYLDLGPEVVELVTDIEEQINAADEDDDGPDGDPGEPAAAPEPVRAAIVAVPSTQVAIEPDAVEPAEPAEPAAKSGPAATEHDTDAA